MIGRIYKVQHLDSSLCYIGSTCNTIRDRWRTHKGAFGQWDKGNDDYYTVALYPYLKQYGIDRFKMLLVKEYQIADKNQLRAYEQLAINRTKLCCNKNAALHLIGSKSLAKHYRQCISEQSKDHYQANKQAFKDYYQANKDSMIKRSKDHYQANKDTILKRSKDHYQANKQAFKDYYQANKDSMIKRSKDHYQANKEAIKQKAASRVICECGTETSKSNISNHRKTTKHARLLAALNAPTQ